MTDADGVLEPGDGYRSTERVRGQLGSDPPGSASAVYGPLTSVSSFQPAPARDSLDTAAYFTMGAYVSVNGRDVVVESLPGAQHVTWFDASGVVVNATAPASWSTDEVVDRVRMVDERTWRSLASKLSKTLFDSTREAASAELNGVTVSIRESDEVRAMCIAPAGDEPTCGPIDPVVTRQQSVTGQAEIGGQWFAFGYSPVVWQDGAPLRATFTAPTGFAAPVDTASTDGADWFVARIGDGVMTVDAQVTAPTRPFSGWTGRPLVIWVT